MALELVVDRPAKQAKVLQSLQDCTIESPNCDGVLRMGLLDACECIDRWWYYPDVIQVVGAQAYVMADAGPYTQNKAINLANKFWWNVRRDLEDDNACWLWRWNKSPEGLALFFPGAPVVQAGRWILQWTLAPDDDHDVTQTCRNLQCVRPEHQRYIKQPPPKPAQTQRPRGRPRKLDDDTLAEIKGLLERKDMTQAAIAAKYGVTQGLISQINRNVGSYARN